MKKGFTLIELLAVIVVLAIVSVVTIPIITGVINKAKVSALKQSAEGLVEASILYRAKYPSDNTVRFDITNNVVTSEDTTNLLNYKGEVKSGTVIIDSKGRSVICVTDGKRSAYKNYNDSNITVSNNETCNVPTGRTIVFLGNEATVNELSNVELTEQVSELQSLVAALRSEVNELKSQPSDATPIGTILAVMNSNAPTGYLKCDGSYYDVEGTYSALAEHIKTTFGSYDYFKIGSEEVPSGKFKVPDLRGEFLRGTGTNGHTNQGSGAQTVGTHQDATIMPRILGDSNGVYMRYGDKSPTDVSNADSIYSSNAWYGMSKSNGSYTTPAGAYTSRPTNTSVLYAIKY